MSKPPFILPYHAPERPPRRVLQSSYDIFMTVMMAVAIVGFIGGFVSLVVSVLADPRAGMFVMILWCPVAALGGYFAWLGGTRTRQETLRRAAGQCLNCGYDLRESPARCPECGRRA